MNERNRRIPRYAWAAFALIAGLIALPPTRFIAYSQITRLLPSVYYFAHNMDDMDRAHQCALYSGYRSDEVAARYRNDLQIQLGNDLFYNGERKTLDTRMVDRFPGEPVAYAYTLHKSSGINVQNNRGETDLLYGRAVSASTVNNELLVQRYIDIAARAEAIDPGNALFPLLRARGLYLARRDQEALDCIYRAAAMPRYDSYDGERMQGALRMCAIANGPHNMFAQVIAVADTTMCFRRSQTPLVIATYQAVQAERQGDTERGYNIRRAVRACGELMLRKPQALATRRLGAKVAQFATMRIGGEEYNPQRDPTPCDEESRQELLTRYQQYMTRNGHPEEAAAAQADFDAASALAAEKIETDKRLDSIQSGFYSRYIVGASLLINAFWLALLGFAASRLVRTPNMRLNRALPSYVRRGLTAEAFVTGAVVVFFNYRHDMGIWRAAAVALCAAVPLFVNQKPGATLRTLKAFALSGLCALIMGVVMAWHLKAIGLFAISLFSSGTGTGDTDLQALALFRLALIPCVVPALIAMVSVVFSRMVRTPVSVGLARGFRQFGLPAACLLVLGWAVFVVSAAQYCHQWIPALQASLGMTR